MSVNTKNDAELFRFIDSDTIQSEKIIAPRYSYWKSVFRVFFRKKINILLIALLTIILIACFTAPLFAEYDPFENVTTKIVYDEEVTTFVDGVGKTTNSQRTVNNFYMGPKDAIEFAKEYDRVYADEIAAGTKTSMGPSIKWILGTGGTGNSIFYGILFSARTSLMLAVVCAAINMTIGIILGAVWGYSRQFDAVMLVIYNIIANVPSILVISVLVYIIGSGFWPFVFALTVTGWLGIAYFFRTQVLIIRDREYSLASRCLGTPIPRMISKNILPFLTSVIVTLLATELPYYISMEVYLSYIGVGLSASVPSLGRMIQEAQSVFTVYPHVFWPPVIMSAAITIILYVLGQNLADASDPRTHM